MVKEFLDELGVSYVYRNVVGDDAALQDFLRLGAPLPPVVVYRGRWVAGYDPEGLERLLADLL